MWLLAHAPNTLLIPGTRSIEHLEENLGAADVTLSADALERLDVVGSSEPQAPWCGALSEVTSLPMESGKPIKPPWWLKLWNKVFVQLSRLGVTLGHDGPALLTVPGRRSGKPRTTPITPMTVDGRQYVIAGFPHADWARNVRAAGEVTLTRGRKSKAMRTVELSADESRPLLHAWPVKVPASIGFMKRAGLVKEGSPEEFEALAGRCAVFRLDPV